MYFKYLITIAIICLNTILVYASNCPNVLYSKMIMYSNDCNYIKGNIRSNIEEVCRNISYCEDCFGKNKCGILGWKRDRCYNELYDILYKRYPKKTS